jgi:eukaryotic-like serine/threonine-protein kinase
MPRKAKPGNRIGKYYIEKELNAGAMAIAYKATCGGETVFFKQYKSPTPTVSWYESYVDYQKELKRRIESSNAKNFSYRFIDFFEESFGGKNFFQVFEWVDGGKDLEHFLQDAHAPGRVTWEQRLTLARVLMAGINSLHEAGIIHCDLKPPNIVLFEDQDIAAGFRLKIIDMDFSILNDRAAPWHGTDNGYIGTPLYFSPEHLQPGRAPVQASDIFTCGLILYELLTGVHPYSDEEVYANAAATWAASPPVLLGEVSSAPAAQETAVQLLYQCLNPDASKRPSAKDVNFALRGKYEGVVEPIHRPRPSVEVPPPDRPRPSVDVAPLERPRRPDDIPAPSLPTKDKPSSVRLELVSESGKVLSCSVKTSFGKHTCAPLGDDAKFMSAVQFTVQPSSDSKEWFLYHQTDAKNQTLVNGVFSVGPVRLKANDVVGVGNAAKGIVKLPMTVRFM